MDNIYEKYVEYCSSHSIQRNRVYARIKNVKLDATDECKIEIRVFIDIAKKKKKAM